MTDHDKVLYLEIEDFIMAANTSNICVFGSSILQFYWFMSKTQHRMCDHNTLDLAGEPQSCQHLDPKDPKC